MKEVKVASSCLLLEFIVEVLKITIGKTTLNGLGYYLHDLMHGSFNLLRAHSHGKIPMGKKQRVGLYDLPFITILLLLCE